MEEQTTYFYYIGDPYKNAGVSEEEVDCRHEKISKILSLSGHAHEQGDLQTAELMRNKALDLLEIQISELEKVFPGDVSYWYDDDGHFHLDYPMGGKVSQD